MLKIDDIINGDRLTKAAHKIRTESKAGIDGITPGEFRKMLNETDLADDIIDSLRLDTYQPQSLIVKLIPKPNGTTREIFVPSVQDRAVQRMIVNGITPLTEQIFLQQSFGFRPARNTHMAVKEASQLIKEGYKVCYLVDLKNFFGNINRERLRKLLRDYPINEDIRKLINKFITAKVIGRKGQTNQGVPAGIPLAPLLANIYLHPFDRELTRQGIKFVRYADDITLFFKTEKDCLHHINSFWGTCEQRFGFIVNRQKTKVYAEEKRPILGFDLDEYGGVTVSRTVTDKIRKSLFGLIADPKFSLSDIKRKAKAILSSTLAYYQIADNFDWLIREIDLIQDEIRQHLTNYSKYDLIEIAKIRLERTDEYEFYSDDDLLMAIIPSVEKYAVVKKKERKFTSQ